MYGFKARYLALIAASLMTVFLLGNWAIGSADSEHQAVECGACHLQESNIATEDGGKLVASQEVLCAKCHDETMKASHPSGIHVARPIPDQYPLDWKGDLTCSTCHDFHGQRQGLMRNDLTGKDFCQSCHDEDFFQRMRDSGTSLVRSGHLASVNTGISGGLDPYSMQCIECHDNEATAPKVMIDSFGTLRHASGRSNHPIGGLYSKAIIFGGYHPVNSLPENVLLPSGRLSCLSCHLGYQKEHGQLVGAKSNLCQICHDL